MPGNGGGLHVSGTGDTTIVGGLVADNFAAREGGGLWNDIGTLTVDGTTITRNIARGPAADDGGGGIFQQRRHPDRLKCIADVQRGGWTER